MNTEQVTTTDETFDSKLLVKTISDLTSAVASITALMVDNARELDELKKKHDALLAKQNAVLAKQNALLAEKSTIEDKSSYTLQDISNALDVVYDKNTYNHVRRLIPDSVYNSDLFDYILDKMAQRVSHLKFDRIVCYRLDAELYGPLAHKLNCKLSKLWIDTNERPQLSEGERVLVATYGFVKGNTIAKLSKEVTDAGGVVAGEFSFITLVGCSEKACEHNSLLYFGVGNRSAKLDSGLHYMDA